MTKPFLILQLRPEVEASDDEYAAFLTKGGLQAQQTHRIDLAKQHLPSLDLADYAGVIVGGGPGCVSDDPATRDPDEARIEADILSLMPQILAQDKPFLGCCYGIGVLGKAVGGEVSKARFGEPVGPSACEVTEAGRQDPLLRDLPERFTAFVGHKEALQQLPEGCTHLVSSAPCPFQMFRYKTNVYATQFHPEASSENFALRIRLYKDRGYFPAEQAEDLIATCTAAEVTVPEQILRNFVDRFR